MTVEQLEASRAERMRLNGQGTLTIEDARTWIEETGLCLFLPKRQLSTIVAPSFVEAVAGQRDATPDPRHIALAEELLVRLENEGVAVRLNLFGQPDEQPDFVVAVWVLPYVYALRGDRDWRRNPQLTGSRQVSQLAVQAYKLLEAGDATIASLRQTLGREVTEVAVIRAITELWQQLRIIPIIKAPGQPAKWQLLRHHYQKAIAEGASTSQVTAISVLASIYLQAVIAASMEDVELFLSPLTARSKVREVMRGLLATRQVHTISLGHSPHFYVAGTLPEFNEPLLAYSFASMPASSYFERDDSHDHAPLAKTIYSSSVVSTNGHSTYAQRTEVVTEVLEKPEPEPKAVLHEKKVAPKPLPSAGHKPAHKPAHKPTAAKPRISRPATTSRDRKPMPKTTSASGHAKAKPHAHASARPAAKSTTTKNVRPMAKSSARPATSKNGHAKPVASRNGHASTHKAAPAPRSKSASASRSSNSNRKPMPVGAAKNGGKKSSFAKKPIKKR